MIRMGVLPFIPFDAEFFSPLLPHLRIIAAAPAGYNWINVDWLTQNNIWFCNTRNAVSEATADMCMFLILATLKNATIAERSAREGRWRDLITHPTTDPTGLTLGIVGMGSIGKVRNPLAERYCIPLLEKLAEPQLPIGNSQAQLVARKALVFNLRIRYYNRNRLLLDEEVTYQATYCSTLDDLLRTSDILSLNCPLTKETTGLIGPQEFAKMKDGAYFVNTARGEIVKEQALIDALESGKVKLAGLDVFAGEPEIRYVTNPKYKLLFLAKERKTE